MNPRLRQLWPWLAAMLSGALLGLCYPRWDVGQLIWVWQVPLLAALWFSEGPSRWRRGLGLGYVAGLTFFLIDLSWLLELGKVAGSVWAGLGAWLAMPAYLAVYFGLWGAFAATAGRWEPDRAGAPGGLFGPSLRALRSAFLNAAAWCGLEWLRGIAFTGFGWNGTGVALHENLHLIQIVEWTGVTGLSFLPAFCNAIWIMTLVRIGREAGRGRHIRPHLDFAVAMVLLIGTFLFGLTRIMGRPAPTPENAVSLRVLLVQLNTPFDERSDQGQAQKIIEQYRDLTLGYVESSEFDLVIWPETALPGRWTHRWVQEYLNGHILGAADFSLILGIEDEAFESGEIYNCLGLMRGSTAEAQLHRKIHRVPFGEYLPLRDSFPVFVWIAGGIVPADFSAGTSFEPLRLAKPEAGVIPLVCFEDTMGRLARKFVRPGPQLMVNVTNDGWFHESPLAIQHLVNAKFRCIELRRPMARAANTGVSAFIDEYGSLEFPDAAPGTTGHERLRVVQDPLTGHTFTTGTLPATVTLLKDPPMTFYARHGDVFSGALGAIAVLAAGLGMVRWLARRGQSATS